MPKLFQIDAFTDQLFGGNPAAVVPLEHWIDDSILQNVAMENNLAETAFVVPRDRDTRRCDYELRWFTPVSEVALCGHATLASAYVLFRHLGYENESVNFCTRKSGTLTVSKRSDGQLSMSFPSIPLEQSDDIDSVSRALGVKPNALYIGKYSAEEFDYVAVLGTEGQVADISPNHSDFRDLKSRGVIITSQGTNCDFVSRYFAPLLGVDEDPVTGSAHCLLTPYWSKILGQRKLQARQISARGGFLACEIEDQRTILTGSCVDYLQADIYLANPQ